MEKKLVNLQYFTITVDLTDRNTKSIKESNMKKLSFILAAIFPYLVIAALAILFFSSQIIDVAFQSNGLLYIGALLLLLFAIFVWTVVFTVCNLIKKDLTAHGWAKAVMLVKLCQIPAYLTMFVFGLVFLITIFLLPFAIGLMFVSIACITMTGLLGTVTCLRAFREQRLSAPLAILAAILQFVFCVDIVAAIVLYVKCKKEA